MKIGTMLKAALPWGEKVEVIFYSPRGKDERIRVFHWHGFDNDLGMEIHAPAIEYRYKDETPFVFFDVLSHPVSTDRGRVIDFDEEGWTIGWVLSTDLDAVTKVHGIISNLE